MQLITRGQTTVTDLTDGYTVQLLPSNYTFQGSETAVSGTQSVSTMAYVRRGTTVVRANVNVNNIITPTGITVTSDGATPSPTLTITATSSVTNGGYFTIPISVTQGSDTIIFNQPFSYSIAYTGEQGTQGIQGEQGETGTGVTSVVRYYQTATSQPSKPTNNVYPPPSPWSSTEPTIDTTKTMYAVDCVVFTDGNSVYSDVMVVAAYEGAKQAISTANNVVTKLESVYGTCSTATATAAKVVTLSGFSLYRGAQIAVQFINGNSASPITLNVNSTNAIQVKVNDSESSTGKLDFAAKTTATFVYDGTYWRYTGSDNLENEITWTDTGGLSIKNKSEDPINGTSRVNINSSAVNIYTGNGNGGEVLGSRIDADGMEVYENGDKVADFGETVTIGKEENPNLIISSNYLGFSYKNTDNSVEFKFGEQADERITQSELIGPLQVSSESIYETVNLNYTPDPDTLKRVVIASGGGRSASQSGITYNGGKSVTVLMSTALQSVSRYIYVEYEALDYPYITSQIGYFDSSDDVSGACSDGAFALGFYTSALGKGSVAVGDNTWATEEYQTTIGKYNIVESETTPGVGTEYYAGDYAFIIGNGGSSSGRSNAFTVGWDGKLWSAEGYSQGNSSATGNYANALGNGTTASGDASFTEGVGTVASGSGAHSEGFGCIAEGECSHAEGSESSALSDYSHAEGFQTSSSGDLGSHSEGNETEASGEAAHSEGAGTVSSAQGSHSEGFNTQATDTAAHSEGSFTEASGPWSHAENYSTKAIGSSSHAEGNMSRAIGSNSHSEGGSSYAVGNNSHAQNLSTYATDNASTSIGKYNLVTESTDANNNTTYDAGSYAVIIGNGTSDSNRSNALTVDWSGNLWTAGGIDVQSINLVDTNSATLATINNSGTAPYYTLGNRATGSTIGDYSFANGIDITASGECSFALGKECTASADRAVALGLGTTAAYGTQTVIGYYNDNTSSNIFEIGNGTSTTPSNAFAVTTSGDVTAAGSITADGRIYGATETYTVTLPSSFTATSFSLCRNGGVAMLSIINVKTLNAQETAITTLPVGWRPQHNTAFVFNAPAAGVGSDLRINIYADGRVTIYNYGSAINSSSGSNKSGTFTYVLA